jgi:hypothetical protein
MNRTAVLALGIAAVFAATWVWHGPLGTGNRIAARAESNARATLDYYEMAQIQARMERDPLTRRLVLSGPADDFQRRELVRILDGIPGVGEVVWDPASLQAEAAR